MYVFLCAFRLLQESTIHPSPVFKKYERGDCPASTKKKKESNKLGASFLLCLPLLFILLYLFSQQTPSVQSHVLHLMLQADLSSIWLPLIVKLHVAPYNTHLYVTPRGKSPPFPSMNAARCFAVVRFVTLINVPLLHSSEETLLCLPSQSCFYSSKTEKSDVLNLSSPKSNQWLISYFSSCWFCWSVKKTTIWQRQLNNFHLFLTSSSSH